MNKGALALLVHGGTENWSPDRWRSRFDDVCKDRRVLLFILGAGAGPLMADSSLPKVPLVRVAVADLTDRMAEYVVLHVLMHHRQELYLRACQREKPWEPRFQWPARPICGGTMALGT